VPPTTVDAVITGVARGGDLERMISVGYYGAFFIGTLVVLLLVALVVVTASKR